MTFKCYHNFQCLILGTDIHGFKKKIKEEKKMVAFRLNKLLDECKEKKVDCGSAKSLSCAIYKYNLSNTISLCMKLIVNT